MVLVNAVNGRLRVRSPILRNRRAAEPIAAEVNGLPGVTEVRLNPAAASLVVLYDPKTVEMEALEERLERLCTDQQVRVQKQRRDLSRQVNLVSKVGMVGSLAGTVGFAYLGSKKIHERMGWSFLAFAAFHLLRNRRTLLR
ncbi:MAG: HMA2 domain-containing protein [Wenzhouxiangella sp.]